jgi:hypothetical protein
LVRYSLDLLKIWFHLKCTYTSILLTSHS